MRKLLISLLFVITAVTGYFMYPGTASASVQSNVPAVERQVKQQVESPRWHPKSLERHWGKHRSEFPEYRTAEEYGNAALEFFRSPPPGTLKKVRPNGDRLYYHPPTNNFGVTTKRGVPKTFFRPNRKMNYWKRQKGQIKN